MRDFLFAAAFFICSNFFIFLFAATFLFFYLQQHCFLFAATSFFICSNIVFYLQQPFLFV